MRTVARRPDPATWALAFACALLATAAAPARSAVPADSVAATADRQPIPRPRDWQPGYWSSRCHQGFVEPLVHVFDVPDKLLWIAGKCGVPTRREAVDANAFDEVDDSTWFTNRNHVRAVAVSELRQGPDSVSLPAKPWTITHAKQGGWSEGFQIDDAAGAKWLVKLDPPGGAQLGSGADMVARTLLHAAGYNVPHNEPVRFVRGDVTIAPPLRSGAKGPAFGDADLDSVLAKGARFGDGSYAALASRFVEGHVLGSPSMRRPRPGDSNDRFVHDDRRELRGLFVLCSWINDWDTEDHQFLDTFVETRDSLGYVEHYLLDAGSSFGASADGPKKPWEGYENLFDLAWTGRRLVTLGFVEEPWRRARQETGLAAVGEYESAVYRPEAFREMVPQPAFRMMTDRDGYWGAKIVASFSDAQIAAAVDVARFEDPRASALIVRNLIVRRDKIARHWFARVAPLDFFTVRDGALCFHDLAVDLGLEPVREYEVTLTSAAGAGPRGQRMHLGQAQVPLDRLAAGTSRVSLEIAVAGQRAHPAHVELTHADSGWAVSRVRH